MGGGLWDGALADAASAAGIAWGLYPGRIPRSTCLDREARWPLPVITNRRRWARLTGPSERMSLLRLAKKTPFYGELRLACVEEWTLDV